jgi:hypothetical protein
LNRPNLLGLGDTVHPQSARSFGKVRVAGVKACDIGRIGDRNDDHDRAVGVNGIATDDYYGARSGLFAALRGVEASAEDITANGPWKYGS